MNDCLSWWGFLGWTHISFHRQQSAASMTFGNWTRRRYCETFNSLNSLSSFFWALGKRSEMSYFFIWFFRPVVSRPQGLGTLITRQMERSSSCAWWNQVQCSDVQSLAALPWDKKFNRPHCHCLDSDQIIECKVTFFSLLQTPVSRLVAEPDCDGKQPKPARRDVEVHRRDPHLGRPERQLCLRVSPWDTEKKNPVWMRT